MIRRDFFLAKTAFRDVRPFMDDFGNIKGFVS